MKRMKLARAALVVGLVWAASACDNGLTDINTNPNVPTDVPASLLLPQAIWSSIEAHYGVWQSFSHTGIWAYHVAEIQYPDEERGLVRPDVNEGIWTGAYTGPLPDIQAVISKGAATGDVSIEAVGRIWRAWEFHIITDYYGDAPFDSALLGAANTTPEYDSQQHVYAGLFAELTTGATMLESPAGADFGGGDLIYNNDFERWRRFANSLRMRLAMRLSEVDPTTAEAEFAAAYAAGGFESNADNAMLVWPGAPYENPYYENQLSRDDHGMSGALVDTMLNLNDPRLALYAEPARNTGQYRGHYNGYNGIPAGSSLDDFSRVNNFWRADGNNTPTAIMTYAEVLFLETEAAYRGWIAADPATLYSAAIEASMDQYADWGHSADPADVATYLAQGSVAYNGTLEQIITQKWIALFMNGPEAWFDNRRTDLPVLTPGPDLCFNLPRVPVRFPYPDTEQSLNLTNLEAALAAQGMTEPDLITPVWWDVNAPDRCP